MSIVSSAAADGFIQRLPKEIGFYLVHGLDEGLTHERVKAIIRSLIGDDSDPIRLVRLEGDAVARDPGVLLLGLPLFLLHALKLIARPGLAAASGVAAP